MTFLCDVLTKPRHERRDNSFIRFYVSCQPMGDHGFDPRSTGRANRLCGEERPAARENRWVALTESKSRRGPMGNLRPTTKLQAEVTIRKEPPLMSSEVNVLAAIRPGAIPLSLRRAAASEELIDAVRGQAQPTRGSV